MKRENALGGKGESMSSDECARVQTVIRTSRKTAVKTQEKHPKTRTIFFPYPLYTFAI